MMNLFSPMGLATTGIPMPIYSKALNPHLYRLYSLSRRGYNPISKFEIAAGMAIGFAHSIESTISARILFIALNF